LHVRVRFFAGTRDAVGGARLRVEVPEGARVEDLVAALCAAHPRLVPYRPTLLLAVDGAYASPDAALREGAEVALMPPVSGGSGGDVAIVDAPLRLAPLVASLEARGAGAIVGFLGLVRATSGERPGARVERLRFEAHEAMAMAEMRRLRDAALAKFALTDLILRHRLGELPVGEPIVAVVAAAPHRRAAFEAAQWVMDELKRSVPIWTQEVDADGAATWVNDPTTAREHHA
jgi:molybdopterin synthase catalytic subunit